MVAFCTSSIRASTPVEASSVRPIATAYRFSILSRTSPRFGTSPGTAIELIDSIDLLICSCILACSSCVSSFERSARVCCRCRAFCSTAFLAASDDCSAWSCRAFRSSIEASADTSWVANACADCSYSVALATSPEARAWSASTSACRADACSRSTSSSWRPSFISSCRRLPSTLAAWPVSAWCWRCASWMACSIWILGSAFSSNFEFAEAERYRDSLRKKFAISRSCHASRVEAALPPADTQLSGSRVHGRDQMRRLENREVGADFAQKHGHRQVESLADRGEQLGARVLFAPLDLGKIAERNPRPRGHVAQRAVLVLTMPTQGIAHETPKSHRRPTSRSGLRPSVTL